MGSGKGKTRRAQIKGFGAKKPQSGAASQLTLDKTAPLKDFIGITLVGADADYLLGRLSDRGWNTFAVGVSTPKTGGHVVRGCSLHDFGGGPCWNLEWQEDKARNYAYVNGKDILSVQLYSLRPQENVVSSGNAANIEGLERVEF